MLTIPAEAGPPCTVALEKQRKRFQNAIFLVEESGAEVWLCSQAEWSGQGAHLHPGLDEVQGLEHESGASGAEAACREGRGQASSSPFLVHLYSRRINI